MQELPEVDIYRAMLAERYAGAQITAMHIHNELIEADAAQSLVQDVVGQTIWFVERRAQHLVFHLDNGKRLMIQVSEGVTVYSGFITDGEERGAPSLTLEFQERRLSLYGLLPEDFSILSVKALETYMKAFGMDPLDKRLTAGRLMERFAKKRSSIKTALLDERLLTGIGNVYADEILFEARLRPEAKVSSLVEQEWASLYEAIVYVLREAISHGGVGKAPMFEGDIITGGYSERLQVYGRAGEACYRCGGTVRRVAVGSRKAYVCEGCQGDTTPKEPEASSVPQ
ncbi:DNA-formamidopyrimidine glycosylase family protein [Paenibacillus sp. PL2-23]|uniref:Fpg/Nei family DNA glycosylase n=1 Tax=Paenibacillus sp. PL2-23 TaxID=2100729 RepID=UPI0030F588BB